MNTSLPTDEGTPAAQSLDTPSPSIVMLQMASSYWVSQCIYAAAKLGIADFLKAGEKSCDELATLTQSDAPCLYRLLRALASVGVLTG